MDKRTMGLLLALLLSLIANIILILESQEEGGTAMPVPVVTNDNDTVSIRPCVYYKNAAGAQVVDSCWGETVKGGTFTMTTLMSIYAQNPDSINCISYSFARNTSTTDPRYRNKLYLILRGCNYIFGSDGKVSITNVSGNSYGSDWVCPTDCPM